jgi:hypothetical protein
LAAKMLGKYGGKTQRESAELLGFTTGAAVSLQQKRLEAMLEGNESAGLRDQVAQVESRLATRLAEAGSNRDYLRFKG